MKAEDIETLIKKKSETKNCDYKLTLNWDGATKAEKGKIVKDILAFFNTQDGGVIIFGIDDKTCDLVGMPENDYKTFDQTKVNDFLVAYTDPKYVCQVVKQEIQTKLVVAIICSEFDEIPIICSNNLDDDKNKPVLQKGAIYVRTGKATSEIISHSDDMREFIGRTISKKSDHLLNQIARLMKGKSAPTEEHIDQYKPELEKANEFLKNSIGGKIGSKGYWEVTAYPEKYKNKRYADQVTAKNNVADATVSLRGWNYPHTDRDKNVTNFAEGFQSTCAWERHVEAYRIYQSGLFVWRGMFWEEDLKKDDGTPLNGLSFINIIWTTTEIICFLKRLYEKSLTDDEVVVVKIGLNGIKGKNLVSLEFMIDLHEYYAAQEPAIVLSRTLGLVELKSMYKEIAVEISREIFLMFNWNDPQEKMMEDHQKELIKDRKL